MRALIGLRQPAFAFFGHYSGAGGRVDQHFADTAVYHLAGFELRTRSGQPEPGSVGVLERAGGGWAFTLVPDGELAAFTRHNWKWV